MTKASLIRFPEAELCWVINSSLMKIPDQTAACSIPCEFIESGASGKKKRGAFSFEHGVLRAICSHFLAPHEDPGSSILPRTQTASLGACH
jgi:hypothetical protein